MANATTTFHLETQNLYSQLANARKQRQQLQAKPSRLFAHYGIYINLVALVTAAIIGAFLISKVPVPLWANITFAGTLTFAVIYFITLFIVERKYKPVREREAELYRKADIYVLEATEDILRWMSETHDLGPIEDALLEEVVENMIFQNQVVSDQIVFTNSEGDQMVGRFQQTTPGTWEWVRSYSE